MIVTKNQVLSPPFQTRVRWQTHGYLLRQSLSFFQNDFAGRVANKMMQTASSMRETIVLLSDAVVFVAVQWVSALMLFWLADPRLVIPLALWLAAYAATLIIFVPRIRVRSTDVSEARSTLLGRIVDSYTNILTVKLFAHAEREDGYARAALEEQIGKHRSYVRLTTVMTVILSYHERAAHCRHDGACHLALDPRQHHARGDRPGDGARASASRRCRAGCSPSSPASSRISASCRKAWRRFRGRT